MKKTTVTRIFLAVLSLALVISAVFAVSAFAEEEAAAEKLEIVSQNVSYEGQTHLFYAVSYENVENPEAITLEVKWTDSEGEHTATVTESEAKVIEGKECRTFKTPGVDAKNFTQKFTVVAKTADGAVSAPKTFSVTEYCNLWITYVAYNTVVGTPTADDVKLAEACKATLQYGSAIQALLNYYPADNTADHPENYAYVKAIDGTANGANSAHVIKGESVTLKYTGALEDGKGVTKWTVYYEDGSTDIVSAAGVFAPKANCIAMANLDDVLPEFVAGDGYYFGSTNTGMRYDYSTDSQLNIMEYSSKTGFNAADQTSGSATTSIVDGQLVFAKKEVGYEEYIFWAFDNANYGKGYNEGEDVVFESDIKFDPTNESGQIGSYMIRGAGFNFSIGIYIENGNINIAGAGKLSADTWYNVRLVFTPDKAAGTVNGKLYVNGEYQGSFGAHINNTTDSLYGKAHFYIHAKNGGSATIDNVYFGYVLPRGNGVYYNDTESYADLIRKDYEDGVAQELWENAGVCDSVVVDGANKFVKLDNGASGTTEYIVFNSADSSSEGKNTFIFETDFKLEGPWKTEPEFRFRAFGYDIKVASDVWNNIALYIPYPANSACLYVNCWYNVRLEITKTETDGKFTIDLYLNGALVLDDAAATGSATNSTKTLIPMPSSQTGEAAMYFDNVTIGYINK